MQRCIACETRMSFWISRTTTDNGHRNNADHTVKCKILTKMLANSLVVYRREQTPTLLYTSAPTITSPMLYNLVFTLVSVFLSMVGLFEYLGFVAKLVEEFIHIGDGDSFLSRWRLEHFQDFIARRQIHTHVFRH